MTVTEETTCPACGAEFVVEAQELPGKNEMEPFHCPARGKYAGRIRSGAIPAHAAPED